jgi:hypothetical protein
MSRSTRDLIYRLFVISHIPPSLILALPQILPETIQPNWARKPLQWYLSTYNDPLGGGKSFPGGWFGGLTVCEVLLQLPYFLWALTMPIGMLTVGGTDDLGDQRLELPSLAYGIHAVTATFAAICELFAFRDAVLPITDKIKLGGMYIPFAMIMGMMAIDMYKRVRTRIEGIKQE